MAKVCQFEVRVRNPFGLLKPQPRAYYAGSVNRQMFLDELGEDDASVVSDASSNALSEEHENGEDGDEGRFAADSCDADLFQVVDLAERGNIGALRIILAKVTSAGIPNGHEAVYEASSAGHATCVEALIAAGVVVDSTVWAALPQEVFGRISTIRALIEASVILALEGGYKSVLKILLRAGAALDTGMVSRRASNEAAWALVDTIRKAGNWEEYVGRHRAILVNVITKMAGDAPIPEALKGEIADFFPPGGH